jgi:WD40 repeat protein
LTIPLPLWDILSRQRIGIPLSGHRGPVVSVAFSPNGRTLASARTDGPILLWDVASRRRLGQALVTGYSALATVAFSPNGKLVASASNDGPILWDVDLKSWQARACAIANRNLSRAEWNQFTDPTRPYAVTCPGLPVPG